METRLIPYSVQLLILAPFYVFLGLGCNQVHVQPNEAAAPAMDESQMQRQMEGMSHDMATLPVHKRVAFMSGHVEAGLALYRAGAPDQAAKHLLHPVSETHEAERAGIDALGFEAATFEAVSKALDEGRPAAEVEPMLSAAEDNMALMQSRAGGDAKDIIGFLLETTLEEYEVGVKDGAVTDPGEYQDAYGFTVVALKMARRLDVPAAAALITALRTLHALWPESGPLASSTPSPVPTVKAAVQNALAALGALP